MPSIEKLNDSLMSCFILLIASYTGLHVREQDREALGSKILLRMKSLNLSVPQTYYHLLEADTNLSHREWNELIILLTISETYFLRDRGVFSLLRNRILPELILRHNHDRTLRIWSAGCSTGEEAYSIAILINELLPDWERWNILILGTDINISSISQAKRAIYSPWSFRLVDSEIQKRYFNKRNNGWELNEKIRKMVTFQHGNLRQDTFPSNPNFLDIASSNIYNMDFIICRNVFVYFDNAAISNVLNKFSNTLNEGGYLLTGHAELQLVENLGSLKAKSFPESVIYQRCEASQRNTSTPALKETVAAKGYKFQANSPVPMRASAAVPPSSTSPLPSYFTPPPATMPAIVSISNEATVNRSEPDNATLKTIFNEAEILFQKKKYADALKKTEELLQQQPRHCGAYYLMSQIYANVGKYEKAIYYCKQALEVDSLSFLEPYYLLAHIAEEQGDIEQAKSWLKKIIYLVPSSVYAYLELALIYEIEKNTTKSQKMRSVALELLKRLPSSAQVDPRLGMTASELIDKVKKA